MDNTIKTSTGCKTSVTRICWSSILAGALVGFGLGFLVNVFGMAVGLSAFSAPGEDGNVVIAVGGLIGLLVGVIFSMGIAGFVSGYLGRLYHSCRSGMIYGFITWCLALILSAILIVPVVHYVSFYEESLEPAIVSATLADPSGASDASVKADKNAVAKKPLVAIQPKHLALSGYILFLLFIAGALSSCVGACMGMRCKRDECADGSSYVER